MNARDLFEDYSLANGTVASRGATVTTTLRTAGGNEFFKTIRLNLQGSDLKKPMAQHAVVYSCVHAKASNVSQLPFQVRLAADEDGTSQTNALSRLFDDPNPLMSTQSFFYLISTYLDLAGECIIIKEGRAGRVTSAQEVPAELWPTSGKYWDVDIDKRTKLVQKWILNKGKVDEVSYDPHEIIQVRHPNPYNPYRGLAPWEAAMAATEVDWDAHRYNRAYFKNGADPGGIVSFPKEVSLQPAERQAYGQEWEDRHAGPDKTLRTAILDKGATYTSLQGTFRDMQWINQRKWNRAEIMMVFRCPPGVIGIYEEVNYATAKQESQDFWSKTLQPILSLIKDALWSGLFRWVESGKYIGLLDTSDVSELQEDLDEQLERAAKMAALGWTAEQINERLKLGMPINPWQRTAWTNMGMVPFDVLMEDPFDEGSDEPEEGPEAEPAPAADDEEEEAFEEIMGRERSTTLRNEADEKRRADLWHAYIKTFASKHEGKFKASLRQHFKGITAEVLTNLEASVPPEKIVTPLTKADLKDILFDISKWKERLAKSTTPLYRKAATQAAQRLSDQVGAATNWGPDSKELKDLVQSLAKRVQRVDDTVRKRLAKTLRKGIANGEGLNDLQARVKHTMNASMARSLAIARTEVGSVSNRARVIAMADAGIEKHEWISARDSHVRPSHQNADGDVVEIGKRFKNGLRYPHDPSGPAEEIVNCRCLAVPIVED